MPVNLDWKDTYSSPEYANVRYRSCALASYGGWAYIHTTDAHYVRRLAKKNVVHILTVYGWKNYNAGFFTDTPLPVLLTYEEIEDFRESSGLYLDIPVGDEEIDDE